MNNSIASWKTSSFKNRGKNLEWPFSLSAIKSYIPIWLITMTPPSEYLKYWLFSLYFKVNICAQKHLKLVKPSAFHATSSNRILWHCERIWTYQPSWVTVPAYSVKHKSSCRHESILKMWLKLINNWL